MQAYAQFPTRLQLLNSEISRIDLGIKEVQIVRGSGIPYFQFVHDNLAVPMPLHFESAGTRQFVKLYPMIAQALSTGGVLLLDEMDASIHPMVLPEILRWFHDPRRNPADAQLWMTCHNASLLDTLVKEEVLFTEKDFCRQDVDLSPDRHRRRPPRGQLLQEVPQRRVRRGPSDRLMRIPRLMRRQQRRRIFIGCEGDSERSYIALVQRIVSDVHHKVHLDAQPLQPGAGDPLALLHRAEQVITKIERTRERYHEKYLLIDRDQLGRTRDRDQQIEAIRSRINARIIWQDPAHEALILRHLPDCATLRPASTPIAKQRLQREWPEYEKPMSAMRLASRIDIEALRRAAKVEDELGALFALIELF